MLEHLQPSESNTMKFSFSSAALTAIECVLESSADNEVVVFVCVYVHFQKKLLRTVRDLLAPPPGPGSTSATETRLAAGKLTVSLRACKLCAQNTYEPQASRLKLLFMCRSPSDKVLTCV